MAVDPALNGWRRLAVAVLLRAYKDAAHGNGHSQEARRFLAGDGTRWLALALDLDQDGLGAVQRSTASEAVAGRPDLPEPAQPMLPGF
jgi:hypothetical protein